MINYVKYGFAYVYDGQIYLNEQLRDHPALLNKIIKHEMRHINKEKMVDWKEHFSWDYYAFILTHPNTWTSLAPIWIRGRIVIIDYTCLAIWIIVISIFAFVGLMSAWIL